MKISFHFAVGHVRLNYSVGDSGCDTKDGASPRAHQFECDVLDNSVGQGQQIAKYDAQPESIARIT